MHMNPRDAARLAMDMPTSSTTSSTMRPVIGCFVDLYENRNFAGAMRRVAGPATYHNLRRCARSGAGIPIESLIVGERAYVMCFAERDPERTAMWLSPGDRIDAWPAARAAREIDSFTILSSPPAPEVVGYAAYARSSGGRVKHQRHGGCKQHARDGTGGQL
jgi:hypothetical protein